MNVPSIFCSQEIDARHVAGHRSTDYSRSGCRMCYFCHAQLFEITHVANIKSTFLCNPHAKTRKLWKRSAGLPPLEAILVDQFSSPVRCCTSRAPAEMPPLHSLRFALASRLPSRTAPTLTPHSARCLAGAQLPAISCLGAFRPPALGVRGETVIPAAENLHKDGRQRRPQRCYHRSAERDARCLLNSSDRSSP